MKRPVEIKSREVAAANQFIAGWFVLLQSCKETLTRAQNSRQSPGEIKSREVELSCHRWMVCLVAEL